MTVLVTSATDVDTGKTTFATGLVAAADAVGFKPRAGNNYWEHHDDYRTAVQAGRLFGGDARRLAAASPGTLDPADVNPVHRLWRPSPGPGTGILGKGDREFVLDRAGDQFVRNGEATVPDLAREHLPLSDAVVVESVEELNRVMAAHHLPALAALARTIERTERAVVESYADIALPVRDIEPDAVVVLEPLRARVFAGERFVTACSVATGSHNALDGQLETRVPAVCDLVDPVETVRLPALSREDRTDPATVADAYRGAYDAVRDLAGWPSDSSAVDR